MSRYIDKVAFLEHMIKTPRYFAVAPDIENFPTADVEPVRHGHWFHDPFERKTICTVCRRDIKLPSYYYTIFNFCPKCGAKMDGEEICDDFQS